MNTKSSFVSRMLDDLCALIIRRRMLFVLAGIAICLACAAGARLLAPDFTYRAFFDANDPLRVQVEKFEQTFSNDDSVVLIVHSPSGVLDAETSRLIAKLTEEMWQVPDIVRVDSLSNYAWVKAAGDDIRVQPMIPDQGLDRPALQAERRAAIQADPLLPGYLISEDGRTTMVAGYVRREGDKAVEALPIIAAVRQMIERHKGGDHVFHITGRTAIMAGMQEAAQSDMKRLLPVVLFVVVLLLAAANRQPAGVILPIWIIMLSVVSAMGMAGWAGMPISNITAMVPQFILAVAIAESVHILASFYRLRRAGADKKSAAQTALRENVLPTFLTASTTAVGFLSFSGGDIVAIDNLGKMVGFGVMMSWVLIYFILGPALTVAPHIGRKTQAAAAPAGEIQLRTWPWLLNYVGFVRRMSWPIVLAFIAATGGAVLLASQAAVNSNPFRYFDKSFWLRQSSDFAEEHLRGAQGIEVVVDAGRPDGVKNPAFLAKVQQYQQWIDAQPGVVKTVSVIDFLKQTNKSFNGDDPKHYALPTSAQQVSELLFLYTMNLPKGLDLSNRISVDNSKLRISVRWTLYDSAVATQTAARFESAARELGLEVQTTGKMLLFQRMNNYVSASMFKALAISGVLISLLLLVVYRSWVLGVVGLATNFMPLAFGVAALQLAGRNLDTGAVVALSVCLGIVVDDTIHLMHAVRNASGENLQATIAAALRKVLASAILTNLILVIGFGAFMNGAFVPNQNFGLISVVILGIGLVFDLIFLPALMFVLSARSERARDGALVGTRQPT
jgi:uncharacterized protein